MAITEYIRNVDNAILNTVFEDRVRRVNKCLVTGGDTLNITYTLLYCRHQRPRDFLITLYIGLLILCPQARNYCAGAMEETQR
jgi:hypothetical protein